MNKLSKLLNVVIYLCIISYALPTGVMMGIPIQKILVCLLIILGGICLVLQRKSLEIIKSAKLEITLGFLGLLARFEDSLLHAAYVNRYSLSVRIDIDCILYLYSFSLAQR